LQKQQQEQTLTGAEESIITQLSLAQKEELKKIEALDEKFFYNKK